MKYRLNCINLHNRNYMHGTSLLRGILSFLEETFNVVIDFKIRFSKPLYSNPDIFLSDTEIFGSVYGQFCHKNKTYYFSIEESDDKLCVINNTADLFYDESIFENLMQETKTEYVMPLVDKKFDIHLSYNVLSKLTNLKLFQTFLTLDNSKQTWLSGYYFPNISFLNNTTGVVGISKKFEIVAKNCIKRQITYNQVYVGDRFIVYG